MSKFVLLCKATERKKALFASEKFSHSIEIQRCRQNRTKTLKKRIRMFQNTVLIWLDNNIDENDKQCQNTIGHLSQTVSRVKTVTDGERCVQMLQTLEEEMVYMVVSGALGEKLVPRVHNLPQIDSIFVFCGNKTYHDKWAKDWKKVKGVFTEIKSVCQELHLSVRQREHNAIPMSIMTGSGNVLEKDLNQLDSSFMYTQIIKEILLSIQFEQEHFDEFIQHCRQILADNKKQLGYVDHFAKTYRDETPIWWYTCEFFLYQMVNEVLRKMDIDLIVKLGFFINDLHRQIEELHKEQFGDGKDQKSFIVYRGQGIEKEAFKKMSTTKGGLLSFNCFLSTSKKPSIAQGFADRAAALPDMVSVLFVMTIDPVRSTTPFAFVDAVSGQDIKEHEMLFSMHTVFRIGKITSMDKTNRAFQVELTLSSDNDEDLRLLTDHIRNETFPDSTGWYRLGQVLLKLGEAQKAEQVYNIVLEQTTDESKKAPIYHQLGAVHDELGNYEKALEFYQKDLQMIENSNPPNDSDLAISYNNIGNVHACMGNYPRALSAYKKLLEIRQQSSSASDRLQLATCYNNIGNVYAQMDDARQALSSHEKAHDILRNVLPTNHPNLATSHYNLGLLYEQNENYSEAHQSYKRAAEIGQRALPPKHPDLQDYQKALARVQRK